MMGVMRSALAFALLLAVPILAGCDEKVRAPAVPDVDGSTGMVVPPPLMRRDGGSHDAGTAPDGSAADGSVGMPDWCVAVAGPSDPNSATVLSAGEPVAFPVMAAFTTWDSARCLDPTLLVGLTTGTCVPANGEQLLFAIDRAAIEGMVVRVGTNIVDPETGFDDPITVRFYAPRTGGAVDEWGTCAGSSGTITFEDVGAVVGERILGSYSLTLTDCREPIDQPPIDVSGTFDVTIAIPFEDVCL